MALLYYAIGLWAFSAVRVVAATFFALKDTRTPMIMATVSILANIMLGIVLMGPLGHGGLALATSLASVLNLGLLVYALRRKLGSLGWRRIAQSAFKTMGNAAIMGAVVWTVTRFLIETEGDALTGRIAAVAVCVMIGLAVFGVCSYLTRSPEFGNMVVEVKKGIRRK
jgi:putative peptidoglycan lipid II flippase